MVSEHAYIVLCSWKIGKFETVVAGGFDRFTVELLRLMLWGAGEGLFRLTRISNR